MQLKVRAEPEDSIFILLVIVNETTCLLLLPVGPYYVFPVPWTMILSRKSLHLSFFLQQQELVGRSTQALECESLSHLFPFLILHTMLS